MMLNFCRKFLTNGVNTPLRHFSLRQTNQHLAPSTLFMHTNFDSIIQPCQILEETDAAAGAVWCIQTYDRKLLKMKKHKRQKRKKEMLTKLKWSGKI